MGYIVILVVFLFSITHFTEASSANPATCQPWRVPVEVDAPNHNLKPFYIEMHRCMGQCTGISNTSPLSCECVPTTTQAITVQAVGLLGKEIKTFQNHTSCKSQCKAASKQKCVSDGHQWDKNTCICACPAAPSGGCPPNQVWNSHSCKCECSSSQTSCTHPSMAWNKSSCSCQCSVTDFAKCAKLGRATDMKTCRCQTSQQPRTGQVEKSQTNESETKLVVSLVAIGLLLGMLFVIDLVLMCSKKGFMYGLVTKCNERNGNEEFINATDTDTGSTTLDVEPNYPAMNGNCKHKPHYIQQDSITSV